MVNSLQIRLNHQKKDKNTTNMKTKLTTTLFIIFTISLIMSCKQKTSLKYPKATKVDSTDIYFGIEIADPYRWLENNNSTETKEWINAENKITNQYLNQIPFKNKIKNRLTEVWAYEKLSTPSKKGDYIFYYKHDGAQNHPILYVKNIHTQDEKVLIDPNLFSDDGTTSLAGTSVSIDGKHIAYSISKGGSDWREVFVLEVESGDKLTDHLKWIKFSDLSWDNDGFFYSRYDEPKEGDELSATNNFQKVYYHKLGTPQSDDKIIFENPNKAQLTYSAEVSENQDFLILYTSESTQGNTVHIKNLKKEGEWILVDANIISENYYIATINNRLVFLTNQDADRYKLVSINPHNPSIENWEDLILEENNVLKGAKATQNYIVAHYMVDAQSELKVFNTNGEYLHTINLPTSTGAVTGIESLKKENKIYYTFTSYTTPHTVMEYNLNNKESDTYFKPNVDFNSQEYTTKLVFVPAEDGAQIPLHIVHKKDLVLNGQSPTILYGYGGFNIVYQPGFDVRIIPWLENGGIYVNAHIRGGGEYGEGWYRAGIKLEKQRVFDDFILAAEHLIEAGYTSSEKLAIMGGSNGGLLVGAVANQRPELFKVALPAVGVMDMLRYQHFTIGWAWAGDYGRSDDSPEMFRYLLNYSPLHNIPKGDLFPATLITTADHDDRVVPAHSFKYAATLQENYTGKNPVLIRIETKAGHGAGKPISMQIEEVADKWAFTLYNMGDNFQ